MNISNATHRKEYIDTKNIDGFFFDKLEESSTECMIKITDTVNLHTGLVQKTIIDDFCKALEKIEFGQSLQNNIMLVHKLLSTFVYKDTGKKAFRTFSQQKEVINEAMLISDDYLNKILNGVAMALNNNENEIKKWMQEIILGASDESSNEW